MLELEDRVNHLDELMAQLIQTVDRTSREMRLSRERSEREMQEFKEEMRLAHDRSDERSKKEMQEFKEEMRLAHERAEKRFGQEMRQADERFKREMQEFKEEMRLAHERAEKRFEQEMRKLRKEWNTQWGQLNHKLGTIAEDMVAPSIPRILRQLTGCAEVPDMSAVRVKKRKPREREFDVIVICGDWVLINETKSTLRPEYITDFYEVMQHIHDYFPEMTGKKFIGAISSLYIDQSLVRYGEKLGLVVIGFGEELMEMLNSSDFVPKQF